MAGDGRVLSVLGAPASGLDADTTPRPAPAKRCGPCRTRRAATGRWCLPAPPRARHARRHMSTRRPPSWRSTGAPGVARHVPRELGRGLRRVRRRPQRARAEAGEPRQGRGAGARLGALSRRAAGRHRGDGISSCRAGWRRALRSSTGRTCARSPTSTTTTGRIRARRSARGHGSGRSSTLGGRAPRPCSWDATANSWQDNRRQNGLQAFYFANRFHDHLARRWASPIAPSRAPTSWCCRRTTARPRPTPTRQQREHAHAARRPVAADADVPLAPRRLPRPSTAATTPRSSTTSTRTGSRTAWSPTRAARAR